MSLLRRRKARQEERERGRGPGLGGGGRKRGRELATKQEAEAGGNARAPASRRAPRLRDRPRPPGAAARQARGRRPGPRGLNPFRPVAAGRGGVLAPASEGGGWAATRALRAPSAPGRWRSHALDGRGAARAETPARLAPWRLAESAGGRGGPSGGPRGAWQPPAGTQPARGLAQTPRRGAQAEAAPAPVSVVPAAGRWPRGARSQFYRGGN
ncbi:translation initiation factor IF-2-like [Moschus berezovskii]|uniref:translation initiation factor IF-2-like n=1 Tax=Moschus berezovskii TaxID=68408 RepID=UPI00244432E9|nr:translation initiation factor IF-2-like [Moschus berezovskii]